MTDTVSVLVQTPDETREHITEAERRARVLEAAALEIEVRGWHQGSSLNLGTGSVCALGAGICALGGDIHDYTKRGTWYTLTGRTWGTSHLEEIVAGHGPAHYALSEWNDMPERTADEVVFLFRWRAEEIRDGFDSPRPKDAT